MQESENLLDKILHQVTDRSFEVEFSEELPSQIEYRGATEEMVPLVDEEYQYILMQRDVHFSQNFDVMLEYYQQEEAPGIDESVDIEKIVQLKEYEQKLGKNIAPLFLTGYEIEKIAYFRTLYRQFEDVYMLAKEGSTEKLIASLFLSDGLWEKIVERVDVHSLDKAELLYDVLSDERFSDSLAPAFGTVPCAIARLLGKLGTKEAIYTLFQKVGSSHFALEEEVLQALKAIGTPARDFCIQQVSSDLISSDHEKALIVLHEFLPDEKVQECARAFLKKEKVRSGSLKEYASSLLEFS